MKKKVVLETDWILDFFDLQKVPNPILKKWLESSYEFTEAQKQQMAESAADYEYEGDAWNEEELKMHFLSVILQIAKPQEKRKIKAFFERNIRADYENYEISVDVNLMLASVKGLNTPKTPYFFLQELKKGKKSTNDPEAQMLAAMLVAQIQNQDSKPVFGGYVVGRFWFFAVLEGKNYSLSSAFDITQQPDIEQVICCLRKLKELVLE